MPRIDLVLLSASQSAPAWGQAAVSALDPGLLIRVAADLLQRSRADAFLFWDERLPLPQPESLQQLLAAPGDVWHAGLALGLGGLPGLLDAVAPTWMLNRDPAATIEATSWRVSLRACLVRRAVLEQIGFVREGFRTLEAAGLEWGHRCIRRGVVVRHAPQLLPQPPEAPPVVALPFEDELRFIRWRFGRKWQDWAAFRAVLSGYAGLGQVAAAHKALQRQHFTADPAPYRAEAPGVPCSAGAVTTQPRVSVIVPTLQRYPYLRVLLGQLRRQTCPPLEVIVIDQTPAEERDGALWADFADLPLKVITLDQAGQCSSRNAGLQQASGAFILFIDDDDEISDDLLAAHLACLDEQQSAASCGVAHETGAGALPQDFTYRRVSDVFPTNNALVRREALIRSGLFDLAYERGQRADLDLGMRIYLSGGLMMLQPQISVLHHHAPRGGLRAHKARQVTYASSRARITTRSLPSVSELYLARRYFTTRQVREAAWLAVFGTFSARGSRMRRVVKALYAALMLPLTLWEVHRRDKTARAWLKTYPQIPALRIDP